MKELLIRSATGLVYGLLLVGSLLLHPLAFLGVYLILALLTLNEFIVVNQNKEVKPLIIPLLVITGTAFLLLFFHHFSGLSIYWFLLIPFQVLLLFIIELFRFDKKPFLNLAFGLMGLIYVSLPLSLFNQLVYSPYSIGYSAQLAIFLLMVIWINDTGAYLIGRLIGKTKLLERISPKKTWEGFIGGVITAFMATLILGNFYFDIPRFDQWIITGVIIIFGTFGDLVESMWKRSLGIKDSGKVLPGHGGWLDRLDSIIMAVPAVFITVVLLNA